jgi:DNA modification methylase
LEPSPELYIAHLVEIFREVKRVLRKDGCLWLNLGDSYVGSGGPGSQYYNAGKYKNKFIRHENPNKKCNGLKPKDLCGIPWRLALALQADGWWLRAAPPWVKKNGMPESCSDRPTTAHEYWFLLTKRSKYFWDAEAVKVACTSGPSDIKKMIESRPRIGGKHKILEDPFSKASKATNIGQKRSVGDPSGRNLRTSDFFYDSLDELISQQLEYLAHLLNVRDNGGMLLSEDDLPLALCINTISFPGSHFATFPPKLIEPIIQVSTSEHGCCPACGAPWVRNLAKGEPLQDWKARCGADSTGAYRGKATKEFDLAGVQNASEVKARILNGMVEKITIGWQPTCRCDAGEPVPAIVLDPFMGACTTALVSRKLGRNFVGAELKQEYIEMGEKRIATECAQMNLFQTVAPLNFLQRGEAA